MIENWEIQECWDPVMEANPRTLWKDGPPPTEDFLTPVRESEQKVDNSKPSAESEWKIRYGQIKELADIKERPATRLRSNDEEEEWEPEEEYKTGGSATGKRTSSKTPKYWRLKQPENQAEAQPSSSSSGSYVPGSITAPAAASEQRRGAKPWDTEVLTEAQFKTIKARAVPYGNYRERKEKERWQAKAAADPVEERTARPSRNPLGYGAGSGTPAASKSSEYI